MARNRNNTVESTEDFSNTAVEETPSEVTSEEVASAVADATETVEDFDFVDYPGIKRKPSTAVRAYKHQALYDKITARLAVETAKETPVAFGLVVAKSIATSLQNKAREAGLTLAVRVQDESKSWVGFVPTPVEVPATEETAEEASE